MRCFSTVATTWSWPVYRLELGRAWGKGLGGALAAGGPPLVALIAALL
jgi:hypothetical protein